MRSSDEQLTDILQKARQIRAKKERRRRILTEGGLALFCLCAVCVSAFFVSKAGQAQPGEAYGPFGSLIASSPYLGYVVIGVFSFALGVSLTLLCLYLRTAGKEKDDVDD